MSSYLWDVLAVVGGGAVIVGVGMYSVPLGVIVGGVGLFVAGVAGAYVAGRRRDR